jgi:hypothetical protein
MNILEFLVRDVSYIFDDVKTFARLRQVCRLLRKQVDVADVRFTIVKTTNRFREVTKYIQVDVKGFKHHVKHVTLVDDRKVESYYGYITKDGLIYKHDYKNIVAIFEKRNRQRQGYYCTVIMYNGSLCIYCIILYDRNIPIYKVFTNKRDTIYLKDISQWLINAPPVPKR